jgi:hypothetical protein
MKPIPKPDEIIKRECEKLPPHPLWEDWHIARELRRLFSGQDKTETAQQLEQLKEPKDEEAL